MRRGGFRDARADEALAWEAAVKLLQSAITLSRLAEEEATHSKLALTFCVVDLHGNVVLKHRMDGSMLIAIEMAERKAYTSASLLMPTSEMAKSALPGQPFALLATAAGDKFWIDAGGVPFRVDGQIVGGFGVSGATAAEDQRVAEAAIRAFEALKP